MAINLKALKSQKETWEKNLERYEKIKDEMQKDYANWRDSVEKNNQWKVINNDIKMCRLNIDIVDMKEQIKNLQEQNVKLKTNM
jgi:chromosome segregation ATPase